MSDTRRRTKREWDERLAVSQVKKRDKGDSGRRVRCTVCYLMYDESEMTMDFDTEGRRVGLICGSCA